jgi:glycine/D-amino acid oxidase-like deaminating enzyme
MRRGLRAAAEDLGVRIRMGAATTGLSVRGGRVVGVETDRGLVEAERVVVRPQVINVISTPSSVRPSKR